MSHHGEQGHPFCRQVAGAGPDVPSDCVLFGCSHGERPENRALTDMVERAWEGDLSDVDESIFRRVPCPDNVIDLMVAQGWARSRSEARNNIRSLKQHPVPSGTLVRLGKKSVVVIHAT